VALSLVEAEYMPMCQAAKEAVWLTGLLEDLGLDLRLPLIVTQIPVFHPHSKHITIQYHFTCELIQMGRPIVKYIPTKAMVTDALMKVLPCPQHVALMEMMGAYERN